MMKLIYFKLSHLFCFAKNTLHVKCFIIKCFNVRLKKIFSCKKFIYKIFLNGNDGEEGSGERTVMVGRWWWWW